MCALNRGGIGNAPMRGHGLAGPHGTNLLGRVVANSEDEIHLQRPGLCKLSPALTAEAFRRQDRDPSRTRSFYQSHQAQQVGPQRASVVFADACLTALAETRS